MKKTLGKLEELIIDWADVRGIFEHSNPKAQLLKGASEFGELCDAVIKGEPVIDHIGDTHVTLVLLTHLINPDWDLITCLEYAYGESNTTKCMMVEVYEIMIVTDNYALDDFGDLDIQLVTVQVLDRFGDLANAVGMRDSGEPEGDDTEIAACIGRVLMSLAFVAKLRDLTLRPCLDYAWEEIKDRKGHMVEGGAFVKDEPEEASDLMTEPYQTCTVGGSIGIGNECTNWNNLTEECLYREFCSKGKVIDYSEATE